MAISGHTGSCTVNGSLVGDAKSWSLDLSQETAEVTNFGSGGWKESQAGLKSWSGSIVLMFDGGADAGEAGLFAGVVSGSTIAVVLKTGATGGGSSEQFSGNANVTGISVPVDVNGFIEISVDFEGTGELTQAAL